MISNAITLTLKGEVPSDIKNEIPVHYDCYAALLQQDIEQRASEFPQFDSTFANLSNTNLADASAN